MADPRGALVLASPASVDRKLLAARSSCGPEPVVAVVTLVLTHPSMSPLLFIAAVLLTTSRSSSSPLAFHPAMPAAAAIHPPAREAHSWQPDDVARAIAVLREVFAATERGDLAALDTLYAGDSLTVMEGTGINRGWADYRDHHIGPELKTMKNFY